MGAPPSTATSGSPTDLAFIGTSAGSDKEPLDKLERRSTRYRFDLEKDVCWEELHVGGDYLGPAWLEAYGIDHERLQRHPQAHALFQWAMALSLCETFVRVEEAIVSFIETAGGLS